MTHSFPTRRASDRGLIIERQMEHGGRERCAQRPADLDRAHRAAARRAAADVVHQFAKRNAEADLIKAAVLYFARKLHRHGAARTPDTDGATGIPPPGRAEWPGRQAPPTIGARRFPEPPLQPRSAPLGSGLAAITSHAATDAGFQIT